MAPDGITWTTPRVLETVGFDGWLYYATVVLSESGRAFASWSVHLGPGAHSASGASAGADGVWTRFLENGVLTREPVITLALDRPGDALALTDYKNPLANPLGTTAYSYDRTPRVTHAQWLWLHRSFIPAHFAPRQRAAVWRRLTANPSAALALVRRYAPANIR